MLRRGHQTAVAHNPISPATGSVTLHDGRVSGRGWREAIVKIRILLLLLLLLLLSRILGVGKLVIGFQRLDAIKDDPYVRGCHPILQHHRIVNIERWRTT